VPLDDLRQVAALALTKAAHGYDVSTGNDFMSHAGPTIRGELRKYFRDHSSRVRAARSSNAEFRDTGTVSGKQSSHTPNYRSPRGDSVMVSAAVLEHPGHPVDRLQRDVLSPYNERHPHSRPHTQPGKGPHTWHRIRRSGYGMARD
jgi:hypothetical protein